MGAGIRAQRSSCLSLVSKGESQEVDLVPHFRKLNGNGLAVKGLPFLRKNDDIFPAGKFPLQFSARLH